MRTAQVSRSGALINFWHAFGLVVAAGAVDGPTPVHWQVDLAGWGYCANLGDHGPGGLAGPRKQDIDPEVDSPGSMGNWIEVPQENPGALRRNGDKI